MIGTLGDIVFEVSDQTVRTLKNLKGEAGSDWGSHDVVHGKPRSEWIGPKNRTYSFDMQLRAQDGVPPRRTLTQLQKMAEGASAYYFVLGGQPMADNPFKVLTASDAWDVVFQDGKLIACTVSVKLEEYL